MRLKPQLTVATASGFDSRGNVTSLSLMLLQNSSTKEDYNLKTIYSYMNRVFIPVILAAVILSSCTDNELDYEPSPEKMQSRAAIEVTKPGGLIQQADGTWKSENCRVPIVGPGRVINEINSSTVNVIGVSNGALDNIVDTDITNTCNIPAAISAGFAYTPIVSVKDIYHVYALSLIHI